MYWFLTNVRLAEAGTTIPHIAAFSGHVIDYCQHIINFYLPRRSKVALDGIKVWERQDTNGANCAEPQSVRDHGDDPRQFLTQGLLRLEVRAAAEAAGRTARARAALETRT